MCILVYIYVCGCTHVCMHMWRTWMGACVSVLGVNVDSLPLCVIACYNISDSFMRSKLDNGSFGFVFVVDLIHCRFEDRPMG